MDGRHKRYKNAVKQTKSKTVKRTVRPGSVHAKQKAAVRARRPLHKRVLLHPFAAMLLLCAGVLIIGTTLRSFAVSYNVTATVPATIPNAPATITSPGSSQHFSVPQAVVTGGCPAQTYVKLFRNTTFSGVSQCAGSTYQIQTSLSHGANELTAQVYNLTDQAGPAGASVTVYYDQTNLQPPAVPPDTPTTMWVVGVDSNGFKDGAVQRSSDNPTVTGWAPPWSQMTVTFHSDPQTCITQADGIGWWTCTLDHDLPAGIHRVDVKAITAEGQTLTFPTFKINVQQASPSLLVTPAAEQLLVRADYHYQVHLGYQAADVSVGIIGGTLPYAVAADWGDGTTTKLTRSDSSPFTIGHTYPTPPGPNKDYTVLVKATDAKGEAALVQLAIVVKGNGIVLLASNSTASAILDGLHHWLWLIWPAYVIVVLMAVGYYLGEREEYRHLLAKKRVHIGKTK
jgi:hypothetical protein